MALMEVPKGKQENWNRVVLAAVTDCSGYGDRLWRCHLTRKAARWLQRKFWQLAFLKATVHLVQFTKQTTEIHWGMPLIKIVTKF